MKEEVAGSAATELLHAVLGAIMKDLSHVKWMVKDYRPTLLPDLGNLRQSEACEEVAPSAGKMQLSEE